LKANGLRTHLSLAESRLTKRLFGRPKRSQLNWKSDYVNFPGSAPNAETGDRQFAVLSWVWRALRAFRPRACVVEYNASIPPQDDWEIPYEAEATWDETLIFGAGLLALEKIGKDLGYSLVACDLSGANAFFVRSDLTANLFSEPFTALHHYEPPRLFLGRSWGHAKPLGELSTFREPQH
jgi:hypothetical protein